MNPQYTQCQLLAEFPDTCVVQRAFNTAAADRVMHVKVSCLFGACSGKDELLLQLSRIGESLIIYRVAL